MKYFQEREVEIKPLVIKVHVVNLHAGTQCFAAFTDQSLELVIHFLDAGVLFAFSSANLGCESQRLPGCGTSRQRCASRAERLLEGS